MHKLTEVIQNSMKPAWGQIEQDAIQEYTLGEILQYVETVSASEIVFIRDAFSMNMELLEEGLQSSKTSFGPMLKKQNGGKLISDNENRTAQLLCNGALEARVLGLNKPAMSIAGSGVCGIITTLPLFAYQQIYRDTITVDQILYATALSYLVTIHIKEKMEKDFQFCGCEIAAGVGMACGLCYLQGGRGDKIQEVIDGMVLKMKGLVLEENKGCVRTGIMLVDASFQVVETVMKEMMGEV